MTAEKILFLILVKNQSFIYPPLENCQKTEKKHKVKQALTATPDPLLIFFFTFCQ